MKRSFPLDWPHDQSRVARLTAGEPAGSKPVTLTEASARLERALNLPVFGKVELSANVPQGPRGGYLSETARGDPAAALRFTFKGRDYHVGQDAWTGVRWNVWSLALMAEGLRQTVRHAGDALFERMISGFVALPAPGSAIVPASRAPHEVLEVAPSAPKSVVEAAYRALARERHPDGGGTAKAMAELTAAREAMLRGAGA